MRVGLAELRLCEGYVPQYKEMVEISKHLLRLMVEDLGSKEVVRRFSDPFWFQSLACALGFEHNYTGSTTVTLRAIKEAIFSLHENIGIYVLGGKGKAAFEVPDEIEKLESNNFLSSSHAEKIKRISVETAKADQALLQDSYDLYFHALVVDKKNCVIINQGMNQQEKLVRRYHWLNPRGFEDVHIRTYTSIKSLDLESKHSQEIRKIVYDLVKDEKPEKVVKKALFLYRHYKSYQHGIKPLFLTASEKKFFEKIRFLPYHLWFPKKMDLEALKIAHECAVSFKDVFTSAGIGKSTLRGLVYLASLIYGKEIVWENPQKYCYAFGTKAGKPWYVERKEMQKCASYLKSIVESSEIEKKKKKEILLRLSSFLRVE